MAASARVGLHAAYATCAFDRRYNDPRLASASARATPTWPAITPAYVQSWLDQVRDRPVDLL